jgi:hypothetical protein
MHANKRELYGWKKATVFDNGGNVAAVNVEKDEKRFSVHGNTEKETITFTYENQGIATQKTYRLVYAGMWSWKVQSRIIKSCYSIGDLMRKADSDEDFPFPGSGTFGCMAAEWIRRHGKCIKSGTC